MPNGSGLPGPTRRLFQAPYGNNQMSTSHAHTGTGPEPEHVAHPIAEAALGT